jgi:hypothetical protein
MKLLKSITKEGIEMGYDERIFKSKEFSLYVQTVYKEKIYTEFEDINLLEQKLQLKKRLIEMSQSKQLR